MYMNGFLHTHLTDPAMKNALMYGMGASDDTGDVKTPEEQLAEAQTALAEATKSAEVAKAALEKQTLTVNVDGEDKTFTLEEARTGLSKVGGADKKFRDAAESTKAAERGMRIEALFAQVKDKENPDQKLVDELSGLLGIDPTLFQGGEPGGKGDPKDPPRKITPEDLSPEMKQKWDFESQRNIEIAEKKILEEVRKWVDKDEIIGKMNSVAVEAGNKEFLGTAAEMVHEDVLRKIRNGEPFGAEMIASSGQAARARFKRFGIPEKVAKTKTIIMGLGQPGGEPVSVQPDEPVERVDSSEADYANNFVKRAFQMLSKAEASKA